MRAKHWLSLLAAALVVALALVSAGCGGSSNKASNGGTTTTTSGGKKITVALVSDVGHFNDKSFNQSQLEGLNRAKSELGITAIPLQSNSGSPCLAQWLTILAISSSVTKPPWMR